MKEAKGNKAPMDKLRAAADKGKPGGAVQKAPGPGAMAEVPDYLKEAMGSHRGTEEVTTADIIIPRLEIVQSLSPCRKKDDAAYIEGAEEGGVYNTVTRQLFEDNVTVVPVYFKREYQIWRDRKKGGGFRGAHATPELAKEAMAGFPDSADLAIKDAALHFCLLDDGSGKVDQVVLSMSSSKLKVSRKWNSLIRISGGDSFTRKYRVGVVTEKNQQNQDYFNFVITPAGFPSKELFDQAVTLYDQIKAGRVSADRHDDGSDDAPAGGGEI